MPTNNAIDLSGAGICKYDGAGTFSATTTTQHAVLVGGTSNAISNVGPLTNGQLAIGSTGADPVAASLSAGAGVSITPGAGTITIATSGGGLTWSVVAAPTAILVNNGYGANSGGSTAFTLPATAVLGSLVSIVGMAVGWTIAQGAGQEIFFGNTHTTNGAGGSLASTNAGDCITIVCLVADTTWYVLSSIGNITVA
jgi:hypothetical protein